MNLSKCLSLVVVICALTTILLAVIPWPIERPPSQHVVAYVPPTNPARAALEVSLFKQLLRDGIERQEKHQTTCFIALGHNAEGDWIDPPVEIIESFRDLSVPVKPISLARLPRVFEMESDQKFRSVEDLFSGQEANVFYVDVLRWVDNNRVEVRHGMYGGPLSGGSTYGSIYQFDGHLWRLTHRGIGVVN